MINHLLALRVFASCLLVAIPLAGDPAEKPQTPKKTEQTTETKKNNTPIETQTPSHATHQGEEVPSYEGSFTKMIITLVGLLFALFLSVWFLKRIAQGKFGKSRHGGSIQILEKKPLSQKTMLYLIEVQGQQTLVAESQLEVKALGSFQKIEE